MSGPMNMQSCATTIEKQLELFDIVPDRPLPNPEPIGAYCHECMEGEEDTLASWLRRQSEEQLNAIVESHALINGVSRR
jgi:hypothetical protein